MYHLLKEERPYRHIFVLQKDKSVDLFLLCYKIPLSYDLFFIWDFSDFVVGH